MGPGIKKHIQIQIRDCLIFKSVHTALCIGGTRWLSKLNHKRYHPKPPGSQRCLSASISSLKTIVHSGRPGLSYQPQQCMIVHVRIFLYGQAGQEAQVLKIQFVQEI